MGHTGKASRNATRKWGRKTGPSWSHVWGYQEVGMFADGREGESEEGRRDKAGEGGDQHTGTQCSPEEAAGLF